MSNSGRERDLVLAPNEYALISDQTKGHVITYVGPYKTSLANTDKPVVFRENTKRFEICSLEESIRPFAGAPEGWYIMLKNPEPDGKPPTKGTSNSTPDLDVGRKVNIPGPVFFALWPGQMARVIRGHHLRSNQYLIVRVYDVEQARSNWEKAVITPKEGISEEPADSPAPVKPENTSSSETTGNEDAETGAEEATVVKPDAEVPPLTMGQLLVIKGTDVSFYIPPTGVEVVPDKNGNYVRDAVTLERLEYTILLDENGNKRYIKGPAVVFPNPTERFVTKDGKRKYKAIELNEISGIYVKVIAPYTENGKRYEVGEELFITGKDQMIYFPRPEHALIRYSDQDKYFAVAIPEGEGRYFLNRNTGKISLQRGPSMFLPDPREAVIVKRILTPRQASLWFPGNKEAYEYNEKLHKAKQKRRSKGNKADNFFQRAEEEKQMAAPYEELPEIEESGVGLVGDEFTREQSFSKPRTITLDNKFDGALTIDVWTGYAVQVVSKTGARKVVAGPKTTLLEYEETLQPMTLSTQTPKTDKQTLETVYLRVLHNKVSDRIEAETKDFCKVQVEVSYRVNFTGDSEKWFNVENYVKFLTDHMRSVLRNALQKYPIMGFYQNSITILRDVILGTSEEGKSRPGRLFEENGMHIYDVEVLNIEIMDDQIEEFLEEAQHDELRQKLELSAKHRDLEFTRRSEDIKRKVSEARSLTRQEDIDLQILEVQKELQFQFAQIDKELQSRHKDLEGKIRDEELRTKIHRLSLDQKRATQELQMAAAQKMLEQKLQEMSADVNAVKLKAEAVSPDLIAALQAFGDKALAEKMAESMAPLSILGGKSLADVFANLLKGTKIEDVLKISKSGSSSETSEE